jgi:hypothetical protein
VGGFRIAGKQVWFLPHEIYNPYEREFLQLQEYVLYDFSKNIGETINLSNIPVFPLGDAGLVEFHGLRNIAYTVATIEDSSIGKIFDLGEVKWAEGIGSISNGILWDFYDLTTNVGNATVKLACFKQGNEVKYMDNSSCNSCFCWSSTGFSEKNTILLEVICENNYIKITGESSVVPCELKLFSPEGQVLFTKNTISGEYPIPVAENLSGIYLYQLRKNNEIIKSGKVIIK